MAHPKLVGELGREGRKAVLDDSLGQPPSTSGARPHPRCSARARGGGRGPATAEARSVGPATASTSRRVSLVRFSISLDVPVLGVPLVATRLATEPDHAIRLHLNLAVHNLAGASGVVALMAACAPSNANARSGRRVNDTLPSAAISPTQAGARTRPRWTHWKHRRERSLPRH